MAEEAEIVAVETAPAEILRPAGSVPDIVAAFKEYEDLKRQLLTDDDWYAVAGQAAKLKRSGWQKLAAAFALEDDLILEAEDRDAVDPTHWTINSTVLARARNGRTSTGVGSCSTREFRWRIDDDGRITYPEPSVRTGQYETMPLAHFVRTKAHTRAKLRAIADMLGGAEQLELEDGEPEPDRAPAPVTATAHFLKFALGDELVAKLRIGEVAGKSSVSLPKPYDQADREKFVRGMLQLGETVKETPSGLTVVMATPKAK